MEQAMKRIKDERARGEILLYLKAVYPAGATPLTMRHYLNEERGLPIAEEEFSFQVHYLADGGFLTYELSPRELGEPEKMRLVKISKVGIDEVDGRPKNSSGVRF
jgi:hypothetical protein